MSASGVELTGAVLNLPGDDEAGGPGREAVKTRERVVYEAV